MENNKGKEIINNYGVVAENIDNVTVNLPIHKIKNSILASLLEKLIEEKAFETNSEPQPITYDIREKIDYNNVIKYKDIIEKYASYHSICDNTLNLIDNVKIGAKKKILSSINDKYIAIKGEYIRKGQQDNKPLIDIIKESSDSIMDDIVNYHLNFIENIENMDKYDYEELEINLKAFITYCFIECKILENPNLIKVEKHVNN